MKDYKKYCYYFPNWHPDPLNEQWHGKGWTEWDCLQQGVPRFEGHVSPRVPLWGYEDESDPMVMDKKVRTAKQYGFDGFIFDFYWFKDLGPYRIKALEEGFFKCPSCDDMEFAIMWANHDPIYVHPAQLRHGNAILADGNFTEEFFKEVTDYIIDNYFCRANYIRVDGKIYFPIWSMKKFIHSFGSVEKAAEVVKDFRERAAKKGYELHIAGHKRFAPYYYDQTWDDGTIFATAKRDKKLFNETARKVGLDSIFEYNWPRPKTDAWPDVPYSEFLKYNMEVFEDDLDFIELPHDITSALGWDPSARTVRSDKYENSGYPFTQIISETTPEEIEKGFRAIKEFVERDSYTGNNMLTFTCWNEWTEGNAFEPDEAYGYGYLEAFKKVFIDEK